MISYTIISQEQYTKLMQQNEQCLIDKALVDKDNNNLKQQIKMLKNWLKMLRDQFKTEKSLNLHLLSHLRLQATKLNQINAKLIQSIQTTNSLKNYQNETTLNIHKLEQVKNLLQQHNMMLLQECECLKRKMQKKQEEMFEFIENQQSLQCKITQLNNRIIEIEQQNKKLWQQFKENQEKLNKTNLQIQQKSHFLQKLIIENQQLKLQKVKADEEIQIFKKSPIQKLEQMLKAKQIWINELTKTISQLRQKCIELQMMNNPQQQKFQSKSLLINVGQNLNNKQLSSNSLIPYQISPSPQKLQSSPVIATPNLPIQPSFIQQQRQKQEQLQRIKYLTICRQLAKQFTSKLGKIQQQKKSLQQKYQSIRLKLNQYQYNEFRYKDRINLYVQKIERFQKLTQRQQEEMQRLIEQFDEELNNMLKKKQHEVKMKFQEEIQKYQFQLQKRLKQDEQLMLRKSQSSPQNYQNSLLPKDKYLFTDYGFQLQFMKLQLQELKIELNQKYQQIQQLKNQNKKNKKQLEKTKLNKQDLQKKLVEIEDQCYQKCTQLRRYKTLVQQLCHQLQIKTNELQIVKKQWLKKTGSGSSSNSQQNNINEDAYESLSAKLSSDMNQKRSLKRENSEYWEYQVSQIDTEGQIKNQTMLNNLIVGKLGVYNNIFRKQLNDNMMTTAAGLPTKMSQISDPETNSKQYVHKRAQKNPAVNESISSISKSQINSSPSSSESASHVTESSLNSSISSKNSYQSYGIKYLYTQKLTENGRRLLIHKNSLQ